MQDLHFVQQLVQVIVLNLKADPNYTVWKQRIKEQILTLFDEFEGDVAVVRHIFTTRLHRDLMNRCAQGDYHTRVLKLCAKMYTLSESAKGASKISSFSESFWEKAGALKNEIKQTTRRFNAIPEQLHALLDAEAVRKDFGDCTVGAESRSRHLPQEILEGQAKEMIGSIDKFVHGYLEQRVQSQMRDSLSLVISCATHKVEKTMREWHNKMTEDLPKDWAKKREEGNNEPESELDPEFERQSNAEPEMEPDLESDPEPEPEIAEAAEKHEAKLRQAEAEKKRENMVAEADKVYKAAGKLASEEHVIVRTSTDLNGETISENIPLSEVDPLQVTDRDTRRKIEDKKK